MTVTIMKKQKIKKLGWECLKTWVGIFQVGIFWVGIFRVGIFDGGVWWVEIFRVVVFLIPWIMTLNLIWWYSVIKFFPGGISDSRVSIFPPFPFLIIAITVSLEKGNISFKVVVKKVSVTELPIPTRSSHWKYSTKNGVLKKFAIFTGQHFCCSLFLKSCKPKFLRTPILKDIYERLLLDLPTPTYHQSTRSLVFSDLRSEAIGSWFESVASFVQRWVLGSNHPASVYVPVEQVEVVERS